MVRPSFLLPTELARPLYKDVFYPRRETHTTHYLFIAQLLVLAVTCLVSKS